MNKPARRATRNALRAPAAGAERTGGVSLVWWVLLQVGVTAVSIGALMQTRGVGLSKPIYFLVLVTALLIPTIVLGYFLRSRASIQSARVYVGGPAALLIILVTGGMKAWEPSGVTLRVDLRKFTDESAALGPPTRWDEDLHAELRAIEKFAHGTPSTAASMVLQFERPAGFGAGDAVTLDVTSESGRHIFESIQVDGEEKVDLQGARQVHHPLRLSQSGVVSIGVRRLVKIELRAIELNAKGQAQQCGKEPLRVSYDGSAEQEIPHVSDCLYRGNLPEPRADAIIQVFRGHCSARLDSLVGEIVRLQCED